MVSAVDHAGVVGDDVAELVLELLGGGEVDGVEGAELGRLQFAGAAEDAVVDADEVESGDWRVPRGRGRWLGRRRGAGSG